MPQVYAVVHNGAGDFLIAVKNRKGYFFHSSLDPLRGCVYYDGVDITNGGGKPAFPGGKLESGTINPVTIVAGAIQEMLEETTWTLDPRNADPQYFIGDRNKYYGVYFLIAGEAFNSIVAIVLDKLQRAQVAADAILRRGWHGNYDKLIADFACPMDNELAKGMVWNLIKDWDEIRRLEDDRETDWFYYILAHLRDTFFPVRILDLEGRTVGIARSLVTEPGPRYFVDTLVYDPAKLEGTGEYILEEGDKKIRGLKFIVEIPFGGKGLFQPMR